jgi:integrase
MAERGKRHYGTGSLVERNGTYYARWRVDGRQVHRKIGPKRPRGEAGGLTKAEAERKLREIMAAVRAEDVRRRQQSRRLPHEMTIAELGERYLAHAREVRGLKSTTLSDYQGILNTHLVPFFEDTLIQRITAKRVEAFSNRLWSKPGSGRRGGKPLAPKTISNVMGFLVVLLNFAVRKKWLAQSPMSAADLRRPPTDAPIEELRFLEPYEVDALIANVENGRYALIDRALYTLAAYSGLRQGELLGLRWQNVDFARSIVHVLEGVTRGRRSSPKGKRRRSVPLARTASDALKRLREWSHWSQPEHPVFAYPATGEPISRTPMMKRYRRALRAAGLPVDFSFHDLRHTFGTMMARSGVPVGTIQAWMGHADLQTTQLYMHYAPAEQDAARIDAAFGR